jgi:hypothetical protein
MYGDEERTKISIKILTNYLIAILNIYFCRHVKTSFILLEVNGETDKHIWE